MIGNSRAFEQELIDASIPSTDSRLTSLRDEEMTLIEERGVIQKELELARAFVQNSQQSDRDWVQSMCNVSALLPPFTRWVSLH